MGWHQMEMLAAYPEGFPTLLLHGLRTCLWLRHQENSDFGAETCPALPPQTLSTQRGLPVTLASLPLLLAQDAHEAFKKGRSYSKSFHIPS